MLVKLLSILLLFPANMKVSLNSNKGGENSDELFRASSNQELLSAGHWRVPNHRGT